MFLSIVSISPTFISIYQYLTNYLLPLYCCTSACQLYPTAHEFLSAYEAKTDDLLVVIQHRAVLVISGKENEAKALEKFILTSIEEIPYPYLKLYE